MGAFSSHHIDFYKGYPSMYAVDHQAVVGDSDLREGMGMHLDDDGEWQLGCPLGTLPFVTGHEQFPTALDVSRNSKQMGRKKLNGVALTQGVGFDTTEYTGNPKNRYCSCDADGQFGVAATDEQICCFCVDVFEDAYGDSVARMIACVDQVLGGDNSGEYSSQSESSESSSS